MRRPQLPPLQPARVRDMGPQQPPSYTPPQQGHTMFHTYPSSDTVRSLAVAMLGDLQDILRSVPSETDVPPWVLMLVSQAAESVHHVKTYTSYYGIR